MIVVGLRISFVSCDEVTQLMPGKRETPVIRDMLVILKEEPRGLVLGR